MFITENQIVKFSKFEEYIQICPLFFRNQLNISVLIKIKHVHFNKKRDKK